MVDPVQLWESCSFQLNCLQPEEPSQTEGGRSRESKVKYYLLRVVTEDHLQELGITGQDYQDLSRDRLDGVSDRLGKEVENCEQETLVHAEEHKVPPGSPKENIFQNNDLGCQKGEKSENDSLQMAFEEEQTLESKKSCCSVGNFQDNVISGRPSLKQGTYECSVCKRCFSLRSSLFHHQCIPIAKALHKCMQCERVFDFSSSLIQHQKLYHRQKASLKCPECGDQFTYRSGLTIHQRTHKREKKPYTCPQCNQSFHCTSELVTHDHIRM